MTQEFYGQLGLAVVLMAVGVVGTAAVLALVFGAMAAEVPHRRR